MLKPETSFYRMMHSIFWYLEPFRRDSLVWQTDGQTDRLCYNKCRASLYTLREKNLDRAGEGALWALSGSCARGRLNLARYMSACRQAKP